MEQRSLVSAPQTAPLGCCYLFTLARPNTGLDRDKQHHGGLATTFHHGSRVHTGLWPTCYAVLQWAQGRGKDNMAFPLGEVVGCYILTTNLHLSSGQNSEEVVKHSLLCDVLNPLRTFELCCNQHCTKI